MMKGEIDKNYYCSANYSVGNTCKISGVCLKCENYHRKWPTPAQFREEYGEEYPDEGAVWVWPANEESSWLLWYYYSVKTLKVKPLIVCACTPFGKPNKKWRPE